jgi:hypothetical protein
MKTEKDRKRILDFFQLINNEKYNLRKYSRPVLVYKIDDGVVYYSLWEDSLLMQYGLEYVDGWDYKEDLLFCPDWMSDEDDFDDDFDDED